MWSQLKQCTKCKITYPESNFSKDRTHKDNLRSVCKDCRREYDIQYKKRRLEQGLCYDCGTPLPEDHPYKRYCISCLKKREKMNIIYEQQRKDIGLCRQCGKHSIDYSRSTLHCTSCLIKREELNKIYEKQRIAKGICRQCCKNPIDYTRSKLHCTSCLDIRNYQAYGKWLFSSYRSKRAYKSVLNHYPHL